MRVAVTLEQCWHDVPGGVASSAIASVAALREHTDLDVVGVAAHHPEPPLPPWIPPVEVRQLPLPRIPLYESWHRLRWPAVERATGPVDVVHVTGMAMPPRTAATVVTVHDLAFLHDASQFTRRGVSFFRRAVELARRDADVVICPSEATAEDCRRHGFAASRIRVLPWGVDTTPATEAAVERVRFAHRLDRPYVLWLGTIEPRKNVGALLDAFARLDDGVDLVVAGGAGWNDEAARLDERIRAADRPGRRVHRVGFVPADDLAALYAGAAAFCFPSTEEGFGLPVLEAMAQGTPVVTSAGTATAEVVGDAGVTVDPRDPRAIAAALRDLLADPERAAAVGAAGRRRAESEFGWARFAAGLVDAYRDAVGYATAERSRR